MGNIFDTLFGRKPSGPPRSPVNLPPRPTPPASTSLREKLGINVQGRASEYLPHIRTLGVKYLRVGIYAYDWADGQRWMLDDLRQASAAGFTGVVVVHGWNGDLDSFAQICIDIGLNIPAGWALQVHNEMNLGAPGWTPVLPGEDEFNRGLAYGRLYNDVKASFAILSRIVVSGGIVGDPRQFIKGCQAAGCSPDAYALHCYGWPPYNQARQRVAEAREVTASTLWITEIGSAGGALGDSQVEKLDLDGTISALRSDLGNSTERTFWYSLQSQDNFGLLTSGVPDPTFAVFQDAMR